MLSIDEAHRFLIALGRSGGITCAEVARNVRVTVGNPALRAAFREISEQIEQELQRRRRQGRLQRLFRRLVKRP